MPERKISSLSKKNRIFSFLADENYVIFLLLAPAVLLLLVEIIVPLVYSFVLSLEHARIHVVAGHGQVSGRFVGLGNYTYLLTDPSFWRALRNTTYFTSVSLLIEFTVGIGMGVLLNQPFWGQRMVRILVFIPWAVPTVVNARLWQWIYNGNSYGALNALLLQTHLLSAPKVWLNIVPVFPKIPILGPFLAAIGSTQGMNAIIVADEWKTLPIVAILVLAGLQNIPQSYYEAARLDGATSFAQFRHITLPLLAPVLTVVAVLRVMQLFRAFTIFYTMVGHGLNMLSMKVYLTAFNFNAFGRGSALAFIMGFIVLLAALGFIKLFYREELQ